MGYAEIAAGQRCSVQGSEVSIGQHGGVLDLCSPWTARRLVVRRVYETAAQAPRALYAAASKNNVVPAGRWRSGGGDHGVVRAADSWRGLHLRRAGAERGGECSVCWASVCAQDSFCVITLLSRELAARLCRSGV